MNEKISKNKPKQSDPPIHVACVQKGGQSTHLFLQKKGDEFVWIENNHPTEHKAKTVEEAIRLIWKLRKQPGTSFRMLNCGRLYTLPERDEHGTPALFHQMYASYKTPTGVFYNEELGHDCIVEHPSDEALRLLKKMCL